MNTNLNISCELRDCNLPKYADGDRCVLHIDLEEKDISLFRKELENYIEKFNYNFHLIRFPTTYEFDFLKERLIKKEVYFEQCSFQNNLNFVISAFDERVNFISCKFFKDTYFTECNFDKYTRFLGCDFYGGAFFNKTEFKYRVFFGQTSFFNGINLSNVDILDEIEFKECFMGCSFFADTPISKVSFTGCEWPKNYTLAEEQYQIRIPTKDNIFCISLSKTYFNVKLFKTAEIFKNVGLSSDWLIKIFYHKEYKRQNKMVFDRESRVYKQYSSPWNTFKLAEITYRELRKIYTKQ